MIRLATREDIPTLIALFEAHQSEMGCSWSVDRTRLSHTFRYAIASPHSWLCLIGDGCLFLATCYESPLGAGKLATELCFCVGAEQLGELLQQYEDWARSKGCRAASIACEQRFAAFERLYRRHGYTLAETTTSKVL